ncbi:MAG: extracellular solute-binding protein [Alphaproteobacteria bacterium]|nr:extracellular solute-binding protein [Alphaproteobacteria bacterium]
MPNLARALVATLALSGLLFAGGPAAATEAKPQKIFKAHGIAMHGEPKYGPDFKHFDYVTPDAQKGGTVRFFGGRTFDTLNRFIIKGVPAAGGVYDTLMTSSADEAFTMYGLIAETIEWPEDRSWVIFNLNPKARFHDGSEITADDVIFSLEILRTKGRPFYRFYYENVAKSEKLGPRRVKFTFTEGDNRELPLILGQLPVLSKAYWADKNFEETTLEPPLGNGPYKVKSVDPPRSITYERVKDYWAADLPVNVGQDNFDELVFTYYRDDTVALEAFKAGKYDIRRENNSKLWATLYEGGPFARALIKKEEIKHELPTGMQGFVFNLRREVFQDPKVRQALAYAFDFEWSNKTLFYGQYARTRSYFSNSELASSGLPSAEELEILEKYRGRIPDEVFTTEYQPPSSDGSGNIRNNLRAAFRLLKQSGWTVKDGKLTNDKTGKVMEFEILLVSPAFERIVLPFSENLKRLGVTVRVRTVDTAQYQNRVRDFDFDMVVSSRGQSLSPGNEQRDFWLSDKADVPGSRNLAGIKDPVVDELVELLITAPDRKSLITRTRALDRVLLWGHYVIPHWHIQSHRLAWWDKFGRPKVVAKYGGGTEGWWVDPQKEGELADRRAASR